MRKRGTEHIARDNKHVKNKESRGVKGGGGLAKGEEALEGILTKSETPFLLILDCVTDPHNLGAILRTANGAGVDAVIAPKDKSVGLTETVQRVSWSVADRDE